MIPVVSTAMTTSETQGFRIKRHNRIISPEIKTDMKNAISPSSHRGARRMALPLSMLSSAVAWISAPSMRVDTGVGRMSRNACPVADTMRYLSFSFSAGTIGAVFSWTCAIDCRISNAEMCGYTRWPW